MTNLNQPYPLYYDSLKSILSIALILSAATSLFIFFFQPFTYHFEEHHFPFHVISLLNGLVVGFIFIAYSYLVKILSLKFFLDQKWTVGKELGFWIFFILLVGTANFFLREFIYNNPDNLTFQFFITEVIHAYGIGLVFILVITVVNYIHLLKKTSGKAETWNELVHRFREKQVDNPVITITSESPQDSITFRLSEFIFAMVDGNYMEFHIKGKNGNLSRHITRNTLTNVEAQTSIYREILRVHRSYIVNLKKIDSIRGNAQGYKLTLAGVETTVPVSRNYISVFEKAMNIHSIN